MQEVNGNALQASHLYAGLNQGPLGRDPNTPLESQHRKPLPLTRQKCVRLSVRTLGYPGCKGQRFVEAGVVGQCERFCHDHADKQERRQLSHM